MRYFRLFVSVLAIVGSVRVRASEPETRFQFKEPRVTGYRIETNQPPRISSAPTQDWVRAWPENNARSPVEISSRIALHLRAGADVSRILEGLKVRIEKTIAPGVFVMQAETPMAAMRAAQTLSALPEVEACYPVMRRNLQLHGPYLFQPNDPYFNKQWHLEHRNPDSTSAGIDLNTRAAWPFTRGNGVIVGVSDDGIELTHPDLAVNCTNGFHFNFGTGDTNTAPTAADRHATAVAGLIAAGLNNRTGGAGVAPEAQLASWKIFTGNSVIASDSQLMDMFQYQSNSVWVQNHSWGYGGTTQQGPTPLEEIGISNAVNLGRAGRGVVICRSGGNARVDGGNANDDGYPSSPLVIGIAAARFDGRVASYSNPGACLLVAAPSSDTGFPALFTTDRQGPLGYTFAFYATDTNLWDYCFDATGFTGTSGAAPQIAGLAALILAANPALTYRDVQQILIFSSRHFDLTDPDLTTNGAGFRVSHNVGFGVPDAGHAVQLARRWINRPPLTQVTLTDTNPAAIPDAGLRVVVRGTNSLFAQSIVARPSLGLHPDRPTPFLPLADAGSANAPLTDQLAGKVALIQRGGALFAEKIQRAVDAGAAVAIIYNNPNGTSSCPGGDNLCTMGGTDFVPIPAVFIGETDGENLQSLVQMRDDIIARLELKTTNYTFVVTNSLLCEHVAVKVQTDHPRRSDVRITLTSPAGTRSVLERLNNDSGPGPIDWTYYSTHHFFENSAGTWTVSFSDEISGATGNVRMVALTISGVSTEDSDHDGLDDTFEMSRFGSLAARPADDPDGDGYSNAQEQILGTNPVVAEIPLQLDLSRWNGELARLSWAGSTNFNYEVNATSRFPGFNVFTNVPGKFPETEWFVPYSNSVMQFFQLRRLPAP